MSERERFIDELTREVPVTLKVIRAYPEHQADWRPHEKSKTAKELAWTLAYEEQLFVDGILSGKIDFENRPSMPETMAEIADTYETIHQKALDKLRAADDATFEKLIPFFVAPKTPGDLPATAIGRIMLSDMIHHRGQFSVYLRAVGGAVPSIYGPTADEPWQ